MKDNRLKPLVYSTLILVILAGGLTWLWHNTDRPLSAREDWELEMVVASSYDYK